MFFQLYSSQRCFASLFSGIQLYALFYFALFLPLVLCFIVEIIETYKLYIYRSHNIHDRKLLLSFSSTPCSQVIIFMGRTAGDLTSIPKHQRHSMVSVNVLIYTLIIANSDLTRIFNLSAYNSAHQDRKSTRLNSSHPSISRMPSSA